MKRTIAAAALFIGSLLVAAPAPADPACTVQPVVAGECVSQPVADYVNLQLEIVGSLTADRADLSAALQAEQAAHQETRLLLASARTQVAYLEHRLVKKQETIAHLRSVIRQLRAQ
jgi:hypothetical protein